MLLNVVKCPTCFEDLRTVDHQVYATFRDACYARGLLDDDKEYVEAVEEASLWGSEHYLRKMFATLLISNSISRPESVWEQTWRLLSSDIHHQLKQMLQDEYSDITDDELKERCLQEVETILRYSGWSLIEFLSMPVPQHNKHLNIQNRMIADELRYNRRCLQDDSREQVSKLNDEQKIVYEKIMGSIKAANGGVFFLYGYGGTGKTFIWKTLSAALRSKGKIVLNVASSGIASLLLPEGRTAHSRFAIPLNANEDSTCNIKQESDLANLVITATLIIWDEAPMMHRNCFESLDRTLKDIMQFSNPLSSELPFGGKTIILGGDLRQILPVIPKGTRQDIVQAALNSSYLWNACEVLKLTKNMRLDKNQFHGDISEVNAFSKWILHIGDGNVDGSPDDISNIHIQEDLLIKCKGDPISDIVNAIYAEVRDGQYSEHSVQEKAILAPTLEKVELINNYMVSFLNIRPNHI